jgi:KDO2-lipid IV(A) lauroyltransferase
MTHLTYSLRASRWGPETSYSQDDDALHWTNARGKGSVRYVDITKLEVYKFRFLGSRTSYWRCVLHCPGGQKIRLQAAHHVSFRRIEDRTASYIPFIKRLESRIRAVNPTVFSHGGHWIAILDAWRGHLVVLLLHLARSLPLDAARTASVLLIRTVGPMLKGHRVARMNLTHAFPEKSQAEIERILTGMWDNLGRIFAEYAHIDRLWDHDLNRTEPGHILIDETNRRRLEEFRKTKGPLLAFSAHVANWELMSWVCGSFEGAAGIVYRPTGIGPIDRKLLEMRVRSRASFIRADAKAYPVIKRMFQAGQCVGMLVDEHFARGVDVSFFGRTCKATPLPARYARQFGCAIRGARLIRQPDGRFRLELTEPLAAPRDAAGRVDVVATTQMIIAIIEGWIRDYPEQWLWIQNRWRPA